MKYLLGIDVSTTGVKAILIDQQGQLATTVNIAEGAALLAGVGAGLWADTDQACR
jgi:sugar (pentulose or hexulose) kinase